MKKKFLKQLLAGALALSMAMSLVETDMAVVHAEESEPIEVKELEDETTPVVVTPTPEETPSSEDIDSVIDKTIDENLEGTPKEDPEDADKEKEEEEEEEEQLKEEKPVLRNRAAAPAGYAQFTEDYLAFDEDFGTKGVNSSNVYSEAAGEGFMNQSYPNAAAGWVGNVYYPRVITTEGGAGSVVDCDGYVEIKSKVWTETESTGYGVYTYENTSNFAMDLPAADYKVEVTFVNPTDKAYNAYVKAEDITKVSNIDVAAGATKTVEFTSCLVEGTLNIAFLGTSSATTEGAAEQSVYVSHVKITRLATNAAREDDKPTIFIASDSTVQSYEKYYYPQTGWGQVLAEFFGEHDYEEVTSVTAGYSQSKTYEVNNAVIENRAIGGRSSSSFVTEGKLDDLLEDIRPGDYLLVQWGHNDATYSRPNRYVASSDFEKWMQYYVDGAIQRGATPILVTPVARYSYTTDANGDLVSYASNFEAYRQVMIKMSQEQGIALIDLTQRSIDVANSFGIDGGKSLWLYTNAGDYTGAYANGSTDSTHLQWYGAFKFAQCVAAGIVDAGNSEVYVNENNSNAANKDALKRLADLVDLRAASKAPGKIEGLKSGAIGASSISMNWTADPESEMYHIYRVEVDSVEAGEKYVFAEDAIKYSVSRSVKYQDSGCEAGKTYVYAVRGYNSLGLGEISENIVVTTKAAGFKFDFNYNNSATAPGWIGVNQNQMYDADLGYGWTTAPNNGRVRGNNGTVSEELADMAGDFNLGAGTFAVDLPNGDYEVTIYAADLLAGTSTIKPSYVAEGEGIGGISCKQSLGSVTGKVRVVDGQLNVTVGGTNMYINGMTITEILKAPTGLVETEASVSGSNYTALLSFNGVEEAVGYNYYIKGTTDASFKLERTFDVEKYKLGVTEYGAISVNLGENYEYYVTCYTEDGTESAPSNTVTVKALLDVATPKAPTNVRCTFPTEDAEGVQNKITIEWDASEVVDSKYPVIKYIVYRSDRAEDEKGFKSFEKVGETSTCSFSDTDVQTNINYYYKVCGSNAGGAGQLSEAVKTPVTGSLVPGSMENLTDRAVTAIRLSDSVKGYATDGKELTEGVYVSWRAFEEEFDANNKLTTTFEILVNGKAVKSGVKSTNVILTNVPDKATIEIVGSADASVNGGLNVIKTPIRDKQYVEMQLYKPADETMPDGSVCDFTANDMSVGDVDADGQLELIVKWYPSNAKDNSGAGYTGKTFLDTYDVDWNTGAARLLSRIDLGVNIRSGAHYTQFQVWDFDGDGKAEIAAKTADGSTIYVSTDGTDKTLIAAVEDGNYVGKCDTTALPTEVVSEANDYRNGSGYVLAGPEYFTMFNPEDGTILDTVEYTPGRGSVAKWGDAYGNRVDRFLSATAYLDGVHPFAVMCRGYYTRTALTAYGTKDTNNDGVGDVIYTLWAYDTDNGDGPEGQGNHNLAVADVDHDGKDEIIYGSSCYDHNGTLKYSTDFGHGDAMHVSDWIAENSGLEVMEVHEEWNQKYQVEIHDAETGEVIIGYPVANADVGRGVAADIDPTSVGAEFWASNGPSGEGEGEWDSTDSSVIATAGSNTSSWNVLSYGATPAANATLYWDGDLLAEIQDHKFESKNGYYPISTYIGKWNYQTRTTDKLLDTAEIFTSNGTKGNLGLIADLTGDWRDEFIARCSADNSKIRLYATTYVTDYVIPCALDDLQYREGVAWENVGYNQPTHTSYLVSKGLVTAQISATASTAQTDSLEVAFTPANDGAVYGHEVSGYAIYRAKADGDFELIATVDKDDLKPVVQNADGSQTEQKEELVEPVKPVKYAGAKFDFGAGAVQDGYTKVDATALYNAENGYGFTSVEGLSNKAYKNWNDDENAALYNDCVLGWIANGSAEFKLDLPNGTYDVTFTIANGSGAAYDAVTAEGVAYTDVRRGNTDIQATSEMVTVVVEDGQLNIVNTVSKSGYAALYFTAITVEENDAAFATKMAAYAAAKAAYDAAVAAQNVVEEEKTVDQTYGVVRREYKFDFGAGAVAEGYTQVLADAAYSTETGFGFRDLVAAGNSTAGLTVDDEALYGDNVLFYDKAAFPEVKEFMVDVENGNYDVTFTVAGKNIYNDITVEGAAFAVNSKTKASYFRYGSGGGFDSVTEAVTVEDGQLNLVSTTSKSGYYNVAFNALSIIETDDSYNARIAEAKAKYEEEHTKQEAANGNGYLVYTDNTVKSGTEYSYKIAAVVDGHETYMSKAVTLRTQVNIKTIKDKDVIELVQGTKINDSVAELLPDSLTCTYMDGEDEKEIEVPVIWTVDDLDITTAGKYEVPYELKGYGNNGTVTVKVVANSIKGIAALSPVNVIAGSAKVDLPATIKVEYTNGTSEDVAVTWDMTGLDLTTVGEYTLTGTVATDLAGLESNPTITVKVVDDYPVEVASTSIEVECGKNIVDFLPATVEAKMASGNRADVAVTWKTEGVDTIDTSTPGSHMIHGTVDGINADILCDVNVAYKALYKFDFGISADYAADGWTTITVNPKGGNKTVAELGVAYTEEIGYGFADPTAVFEGRTEAVEGNGLYPTNVTTDFAIPSGQTFVVDLEKGDYLVQVMTNCGIGSTSATVVVEGTSQSFSANKSFTVKDYTVTVEDGQLTVEIAAGTPRIGAIVVRQMKVEETEVPATPVTPGNNTIIGAISNAVSDVVNTVANAIESAANAVGNFFGRIFGRNTRAQAQAEIADDETPLAAETVEETKSEEAVETAVVTDSGDASATAIADEEVPTSGQFNAGARVVMIILALAAVALVVTYISYKKTAKKND